MDLQFDHSTEIYALRPCHSDDARDLVAIGGLHTVQVLSVNNSECRCIASFHVGTRITSIAWSSATVSPLNSDNWSLELAVATENYGLHLLTKSSTENEHIFAFGGGLSGHHGLVNDMTFCGGWSDDSSRYVATVSDDKMLMVWDLHPSPTSQHPTANDDASMSDDDDMSTGSPFPKARPQPTAYVIPFPHPLTSISSHPLTSKEFLVSDCRGSVYLTDWRSDASDIEQGNLRHSNVVELVEPYALSASCMGQPARWSGSTAWRSDSVDMIGGVFGTKFSIWDLSNMRGGKPGITAQGSLDGGHRFRQVSQVRCIVPNTLTLFAWHHKAGAGPIPNILAQPTVFALGPRPQFVRDFDFLSLPGIPRIAAAVGKSLLVSPIGEDS